MMGRRTLDAPTTPPLGAHDAPTTNPLESPNTLTTKHLDDTATTPPLGAHDNSTPRRGRACPARQHGFTLLEVLVATVIMAVAVTGLLSALSTSMRNAARLTDYDRAALSARVKMDELLTSKQLPRGTVLEGPWEYGGWRARVTPFEMLPNSGPGSLVLDRIELELWWMSADTRRHLNLEAFRRAELPK